MPLVLVWYCVLEVADAYDIVNVAGAIHELKAVVACTVFLDLYYVDNWSLMHDLVILWKTVRVVFTGSGAY